LATGTSAARSSIGLVPRNKLHHRFGGNTIRTIITNFVQLNAQTVSNEVLVALGVVYAVLLILTVISVISRTSTPFSKVAWCAVVVLLPVVGITLYCVRCIASVDKTVLERFKAPQRPKYARDRIPT
jgi:uncharacterized membrane protein YhaH (DUF805 family)